MTSRAWNWLGSQEDPYLQAVIASLAFHAFVVIAFAFKSMLFPAPLVELGSAVRVDLVALPEKQSHRAIEPPPAVSQPQPQVTPKTPSLPQKTTEPQAVQLKKAQVSALAKLKALQALDRIDEEIRDKKFAAQPELQKGNVLSQGDGLTGFGQVQYNRYVGEITAEVRKNWDLPQWLVQKSFQAQVVVLIGGKGEILERKILKSSGNAHFDRVALGTIDKVGQFPPPPSGLAGPLRTRGVVFAFPQ